MEHNNTTTLNAIERDFVDFMRRGDDFFRIELLRPAKIWYNKALELNIETEKVKHKIAECDRLLAFERKVVVIFGAIVTVFLLVYLIWSH